MRFGATAKQRCDKNWTLRRYLIYRATWEVMFKKLIEGFVFGTGFAIAFAIIYTVWMTWALPKYLSEIGPQTVSRTASTEGEISTPPPLTDERKFLGSSGMYAGDFMGQSNKLLATGDGVIRGVIRANKQPVEGVRIRLALNDSAFSQWGVTDQDGEYVIRVPYGKYRMDGYELDRSTADKFLAGKIDHPRNLHPGVKFEVTEEKAGEGLILDYVDPIIKKEPTGEVSLSGDIVARWQSYPGAARYVVQIYENEDLYGFVGEKQIYKWSERPTVEEPMLNLTSQGVPLKAGYYYTLKIRAEDQNGKVISETASQHTEKDFKVIE